MCVLLKHDPVKPHQSSSLQNGQLLVSYLCECPSHNAFSLASKFDQ